MRSRLLVSAVLPLALIGPIRFANAQLEWATSEVERTVPRGAKEVVAEFSFENKGPATVKINSVQSGCGCTIAKVDQLSYEPGQAGTVRVTMRVPDQPGTKRTSITVRSSDPVRPTVALTVAVNVPEILKISRAELVWPEVGDRGERFVTLAAANLETVMVSAACEGTQFTTRLECASPGREYVLIVSPSADAAPGATSRIRITASSPQSMETHEMVLTARVASSHPHAG